MARRENLSVFLLLIIVVVVSGCAMLGLHCKGQRMSCAR